MQLEPITAAHFYQHRRTGQGVGGGAVALPPPWVWETSKIRADWMGNL